MKNRILFIILLIIPFLVEAQSARKLLLEGDFYMGMDNYEEAEGFYQKATSKKASFKSFYNTGVAQESQIQSNDQQLAGMMMQEPEEDPNEAKAIRSYTSAIEVATTSEQKSRAIYNVANTILSNKQMISIEKLKEAIDTYKEAIAEDSKNLRARHNLAIAQIQLDQAKQQEQQVQQQQQEQQDQENKEQEEQEQDQQEQQEQDQEQEEQNQEKEEEQQKKNEAERREEEESKKKASKSEMEKILEMVEKEDQEVQQKMRATSSTDTREKKKKW
jgi:tetratricopeptide (TPR) repeat protein